MENKIEDASITLRTTAQEDLPAILDIVKSWPTHFVESALPLIQADFEKHHSIVAVIENKVVGFSVWRTDESETELLWMAVSSETVRQGIGTKLVEYVLDSIRNDGHVFLLTATEDSTIPGTGFNGTSFAGTNMFFKKLGFKEEGIKWEYWGKTNHARQLGLMVSLSKNR